MKKQVSPQTIFIVLGVLVLVVGAFAFTRFQEPPTGKLLPGDYSMSIEKARELSHKGKPGQ
jgi:hypothetical protein